MRTSLEQHIRERAGHRCEYCHMPEQFEELDMEIEHVIAEQHGGRTVSSNLALACFACNRHKGPNLGGVDPKTRKRTWLYHPRRQQWQRHFRWQQSYLVGRTAIGRVTIVVLGINLPHRVRQRAELIAEGVFPLSP